MLGKYCSKAAIVVLMAVTLAGWATAQKLSPVPQDKVDELSKLVGNTPAAKPAKGRKILVFWRCEGFVHGKAIEYGNKALELAASQTGAYTADFSNDYELLLAENLAQYDAVVLNNTTGLKTWEQTFIEPALTAYVKSGRGLAVIHAGADNFYRAESAAEMVGGIFWGHPWGSGDTWAFKLDEPEHPLNRAFGGENFKVSDEIYQQRSPYYNRAKLRVIVSLDLSDKATREAKGQQRADQDYAVSWVRPYGKGRVFYTSFAHDDRAYLDKKRLTHILDGVQYAVGDLKVDDTPSGLSEADLARIRGAGALEMADVAAFLQDIFAHTGHAATDAANRVKIEALLKDPRTTVHGKQAILRTLQVVGTTQVDVVVEGLKVAETRDLAAAVLAGIPGRAADRALVQALSGGSSELRGVVIDALAMRGNTAAIVPLTADRDQAVAMQAFKALGRVGDKAALAALSKPAGVAALEPLRQQSLAACLSLLADSGRAKGAAKVALQLYKNPAVSEPVRAASARVLLMGDGRFFAEGVKDSSPHVRKMVIGAACEVPVAALSGALEGATAEDKVALIARLAERGASEGEAAVAAQLKSESEAVVLEAQRALSDIGSLKSVPALLEQAGTGSDAVRHGAFQALSNYRAAGTGALLIERAGASEEVQKRVINILAERAEFKLLPKMESFVRSESVEVRREIWKALGKMCDERGLRQVAGWLTLVQEGEINQAEAAVRAVARNVADEGERKAALIAAWDKGGVATKRVVAPLMAGFADGAFVGKLVEGTKDGDKKVREAALRSLSEWPDLTPFKQLREAVGSQQDGDLKSMALRGAVRVATAHGGGGTRKLLVELFRGAPDDRGRKQVVEALFRSEGLEVFPLLQGLFNDGAAGSAAKRAFVALYDSSVKDQANVPANEIEPKKWKVNASHAGGDAQRAIDRNPGSRWSSNRASEKGMWFTLDLGESLFLSEVVLDTTGSGGDTPNGYEVFASSDGKSWSGPIAKGDGNHRDKTVIPLAVQARHLKFVTTDGRQGLHWSIHEIYAKTGLDKTRAAEIGKVAEELR